MTIQAEQRLLVEPVAADPSGESPEAMTASEADIHPEGEVTRSQAALAPMPDKGENLLDQ